MLGLGVYVGNFLFLSNILWLHSRISVSILLNAVKENVPKDIIRETEVCIVEHR